MTWCFHPDVGYRADSSYYEEIFNGLAGDNFKEALEEQDKQEFKFELVDYEDLQKDVDGLVFKRPFLGLEFNLDDFLNESIKLTQIYREIEIKHFQEKYSFKNALRRYWFSRHFLNPIKLLIDP